MGRVCLAFAVCGLRVFGYFSEPRLSDRDLHRVVGEPARVERLPDVRRDLNVITWNIERGTAYDAIASVLRRLDADVILLQEVDRDCRRTGYRNVARDLAYGLDMNWVVAGEFQEIGEGRRDVAAITGQAILSRFRIDDADVLPFSAQDRWRWSINPVQPRRGGRIALAARTAGMLVYNTHIESGGNEGLKRRQVTEILAHQNRTAGGASPVLIAGDLNNGPIVRSRALRSFAAAQFDDALGDSTKRGPTSLGQRHPIDWIFIKNIGALSGRIVDAPDASDHYPVVAALTTLAVAAGLR